MCGNTQIMINLRILFQYKNELCTYVNTLMKKNANVGHTLSTVLVSHLVDSDIVEAVLTSQRNMASKTNKAT
jgi:hypothetical protein